MSASSAARASVGLAVASCTLLAASVARAYPPPPDDCPVGSEGAVGGYCTPIDCGDRTACTSRCALEDDWLSRMRCYALIDCAFVELCVVTTEPRSCGPYPCRTLTDRCASADPSCVCGPVHVCRESPVRAAVVLGAALTGALSIAGLIVWASRQRSRS